ncbi:hypothetical protein [Solemya pervernicosa gill symbiont]|uniref:hypothetical protein n=1 Tax=Solemya pervernicosa gill symbiont TaxID=642797 RepID=UPI0022A90B46|nr:hypothetical protein [Solemya pervernicosa gill symbiont]
MLGLGCPKQASAKIATPRIHHFLQTECLDILSEDVGDIYPRKVVFFPKTGKARVKKLKSLHNDTIIKREEAYIHDIDTQPITGEVELF